VVIASIAILAVMLVPALAKAKHKPTVLHASTTCDNLSWAAALTPRTPDLRAVTP